MTDFSKSYRAAPNDYITNATAGGEELEDTKMNNQLEELNIDGIEFDDVERETHKYPFPVVSITGKVVYCNPSFSALLDGFSYFQFKTSPEYLLIKGGQRETNNSFKVRKAGASVVATLPANLAEKKIRPGVYKIYKAKDWFAIRRYEPIRTFDNA